MIEQLPIKRRDELSSIIGSSSALDIFVRYYALEYPQDRVEIYALTPDSSRITDFILIAQTGIDLFRPLVIPFVNTPGELKELLDAGLSRQRPYLIHSLPDVLSSLESFAELQDFEEMAIYHLNANQFSHKINVLVLKSTSSQGWPMYEIRSKSEGTALAGVNWMDSEGHAEIYVASDPIGNARGFTRSVLSALIQDLLQSGNQIFYRVRTGNVEEEDQAKELGFVFTGEVALIGQLTLLPASEREGTG